MYWNHISSLQEKNILPYQLSILILLTRLKRCLNEHIQLWVLTGKWKILYRTGWRLSFKTKTKITGQSLNQSTNKVFNMWNHCQVICIKKQLQRSEKTHINISMAFNTELKQYVANYCTISCIRIKRRKKT